jgi:hypothetical protein
MITQTGHRPRFTINARPSLLIEPIRLDHSRRDLTTEPIVNRRVHQLPGALAKYPQDPIAPTADRCRQRQRIETRSGIERSGTELAKPRDITIQVITLRAPHTARIYRANPRTAYVAARRRLCRRRNRNWVLEARSGHDRERPVPVSDELYGIYLAELRDEGVI